MPRMEVTNLRPAWRFHHISNKLKAHTGRSPEKKMLVYDVRGRYVYENKGKYYKMSDEISDIYGKVKPILERIADVERQFGHLRLTISGCTGWHRTQLCASRSGVRFWMGRGVN